jgi:hemoglobin/transferrin/lactoferrin receptor protein
VNTATEINAQMGFLQPMDIERVEVLKGPISSLYGSGSTGGVVNVITKKGRFVDRSELTGEAMGAFSTNTEGTDTYGRATYNSERFWAQVSAGLRHHDDYSGGGGEDVDNSQYADTQIRVASGFKWTDDVVSEMQILALEANDIGIPGGSDAMPPLASITYPRTGNILLSLDNTWDVGGEWFKRLEADAYYVSNDRRVRIDGTMPSAALLSICPQADHETVGGKVQGTFAFGDHSLVAGVDGWNWSMSSSRTKHTKVASVVDKPTPNTTMLSMGAFAEDDWTFAPDWTLNLGARVDRVSIDNDATATIAEGSEDDMGWNLHAGLTWAFAEHWSQSLIAASSYRAADILDRFKNITLGGVTIQGNPELDPETSYYFEYVLRYADETFSATGNLFANYVTDYITEQPVTATTMTMANVGQARILGAEVEAEWWFVKQWALYGNAAILDGRDTAGDAPLRTTPPLNGLFGLRYVRGNGFWAQAECQWADGREYTPEGVDSVAGFATANLAAGVDFEADGLRHELSVHLSNLLDRHYVNYLANSRGIELVERGFNAEFVYSVSF